MFNSNFIKRLKVLFFTLFHLLESYPFQFPVHFKSCQSYLTQLCHPLLYLGSSLAMKQWSTPLLPFRHMHSETQPLCSPLKIALSPPPWVGAYVGRPLYTHRPALTSTVPPCPQQRHFSNLVMFHLYNHPRMWNVLVWLQNMVLFPDHSHKTCSPQSPPLFLSVLSMCDLRNHVKDLLAWFPASVPANLDELGHYWIIIV